MVLCECVCDGRITVNGLRNQLLTEPDLQGLDGVE